MVTEKHLSFLAIPTVLSKGFNKKSGDFIMKMIGKIALDLLFWLMIAFLSWLVSWHIEMLILRLPHLHV